MLLTINSDASHLVLIKAKSRLAGYFCLTTPSTISVAEAEINSVFHNAQLNVYLMNILTCIG